MPTLHHGVQAWLRLYLGLGVRRNSIGGVAVCRPRSIGGDITRSVGRSSYYCTSFILQLHTSEPARGREPEAITRAAWRSPRKEGGKL